MPDISIIIISYNTLHITRRCLDTVFASLAQDPSLNAEIIVLDNASSDGSVGMLESYATTHKNLKVIAEKKNLGFGMGNNVAVEKATGKLLLLLNSDTEAIDDAIPAFVRAYTSGTCDIAGARLLNKDGSLQPSAGRFYSLSVAFAALFLFADRYHLTRFSPTMDRHVDWVSGACILMKTHDYQELGGFDPEIFMYWEEVDLQYRAHKRGLSVGFYAKPTFVHLEGASSASRTAPILKVYEGYIHFYRKHYSSLHVRMIRDMLQLKAVGSLLVGKLVRNTYLIETYSKAYEIAQKA